MAQQGTDAMRSLVYSLLLVLFLRVARVYGFVLLSANFGVLLRASIQIHAGTKGLSGKNTGRKAVPTERREPTRQRSPSLPINSKSSFMVAKRSTCLTIPPQTLQLHHNQNKIHLHSASPNLPHLHSTPLLLHHMPLLPPSPKLNLTLSQS